MKGTHHTEKNSNGYRRRSPLPLGAILGILAASVAVGFLLIGRTNPRQRLPGVSGTLAKTAGSAPESESLVAKDAPAAKGDEGKPLAIEGAEPAPRIARCPSRIPDLSGATTGLPLLENGKPQAVIVKSAGDWYDRIAPIISGNLGFVGGTPLAILRESGDFTVENGMVRAPAGKVGPEIKTFIIFGEGPLAKTLGITSEGLGDGGVRVKTAGNAVVLVGSITEADAVGMGHAATVFLEMLGFRCLWPGELGKVVPQRTTIVVPPVDYSYTPRIGQRSVRFRGGLWRDDGLKWLGLDTKQADQALTAAAGREALLPPSHYGWHRLGGDLGIRGGHAGYGLAGGWKKWGKEHPEWFAQQKDGTRDQSGAGDRWCACVSNPGLIEQVASDVLDKVKADPKIHSISLSPNDGGASGPCMCAECKKLDPPDAPKIKLTLFERTGNSAGKEEVEYVSLTDRHVHYWNAVVERVTKKHPNLLFVVDAYNCYSHAPVRENLHPNLILRYVPSDTGMWDAWRLKATKIYWRPNWLCTGDRTALLSVNAPALTKTFKYFADSGMLATDFDGCYEMWATQGLNYYTCLQLNWNPDLSYEEILDDYCRFGFGPAAPHMKCYFTLAGKTWDRDLRKSTWTAALATQLRDALVAADQAVAGDATIRKRIAFLRVGLNWNDVFWTVAAMAEVAQQNEWYDQQRAIKLMEVAAHMLRDATLNWPYAINAPLILGRSGGFRVLDSLPWRRTQELVNAKLQAATAAGTTLAAMTGRENSFTDLMTLYGIKAEPLDKAVAAPPPAKLIAHYRFEEPTWNKTQILDSSPSQFHGSAYNGAEPSADGKIGRCARLSLAKQQWLRFERKEPLVFPNDSFTFALWFKAGDTEADSLALFESNYEGGYSSLGLDKGGRLIFGGRIGGQGGEVKGGTGLRDGKWHHVAIVRDRGRGRLSLFVDGGEIAVAPDFRPGSPKLGQLMIGRGGKAAFEGCLDDLRIYDQALEAQAIEALAFIKDGHAVKKVLEADENGQVEEVEVPP